MRHVLLCGSPVYEGISGPTKHSHLDRSLHVVIHFVIIIIHIHTDGSTTMLILFFRSFVTLAFVIRIRITHKWNLSLSFEIFEVQSCQISLGNSTKTLTTSAVTGSIKMTRYSLICDNRCLISVNM